MAAWDHLNRSKHELSLDTIVDVITRLIGV
jgi:hypothetical protein